MNHMSRRIRVLAAIVLALVLGGPAPAPAAPDTFTPVLARVLATPAAALQTDGRWKLPYEIVLTNATPAPVTIESVEARDADGDERVVHALVGEQVTPQLVLPGGVTSSTLAPGQSGVLFIDATFASREEIPKRLEHFIVATSQGSKARPPMGRIESVAPTDVETAAPIVIGPPLRGDRWVAAASCCDSYHRRAVLAVNGERHLAQRFAIDWLKLDADDRLASGDASRNESFPQFGAEAIAVADGTLTAVVDGLPEGRPGSFPDKVSAATASGNHVVLDLGDGRWALYAHLQPGSVRGEPGQRVKRGDVLGLVGSSGNSDAPHLHFQVMDSPSPLASNGVPYRIDAFEIQGRAESTSDLNDELERAEEPVPVVGVEGPQRRVEQLPADRDVVAFGRQ